MKLVLPRTLHAGIQRYVENAFPNEAGGFLIGRLNGQNGDHPDFRVVTETCFAENIFETKEQYHRYLMEEGAFQAAEDYADGHNLILLGYFHSHPNSPAIPSEFDRVHALPNFVYLILSVQQGRAVESLVWLLADDRSRFNPVAFEEEVQSSQEDNRMSEVLIATQPLVSTDWVAENLDTPGVRLVEIDVDTSTYAGNGHLPKAVSFNWTSQLQDQVARDIISKENFEALLSNAGITNQDHVVIYGDQNNWFAAYAFWLFTYYGHENVSLMNGGRKRWELDGRGFVNEVPSFPRSNYRVSQINAHVRADRQFILNRLEQPDFALVDVRSSDEYTGKIIAPPGMSETAQRAGHIPGASNIPWSKAVNEDGTYKSVDELRALYAEQGVDGAASDTVAYCRIGERSSHSWFALTYLLGYSNVRNYDGSWTEWGNLIGAPIRQGSEH